MGSWNVPLTTFHLENSNLELNYKKLKNIAFFNMKKKLRRGNSSTEPFRLTFR